MIRNQKERIECIIYYDWVRFNHLDNVIYHIANERKFDKTTASKGFYEGNMLQRMGVKAGVLDYNCDRASNGYHGLRIEMKVRPAKLSKEQLLQIETLNKEGYLALVCWSGQEAIEVTKNYLNLNTTHPCTKSLQVESQS